MHYQELFLDLPYEKAGIRHSEFRPKVSLYLQEVSEDITISRERPIVLVCPGGGYHFTSDREAEPIVLKYAAMGYHTALLRYSVAPDVYPAPQMDLAALIHMVRSRAAEWHIDPNGIILTGFSAGGHLAASLCCLWQERDIWEPLGLSPEDIRPNGAILCYPVITSGSYAHRGSFVNLLGDRYDELLEPMSLENRVGSQVPPVFLWHTVSDESVPVENSLFFMQALQKHKISFEAHLYPDGQHGLSLANELTSREDSQNVPYLEDWIYHAEKWLKRTFPLSRDDSRKIQ